MKADNKIKSKALEKMKEVNNSKGGESTSKAQQYLEGLLKIPFGTYKHEPIIYFMTEFIDKISAINKELHDDKLLTCDLDIKLSSDIDIFFKRLSDLIKITDNNFIQKKLKKLKVPILKKILTELNINKSGKKDVLIQKIITNKNKINITTLIEYKLINNFKLYYEHILALYNEWINYKKKRKDYLDNVSNLLDSAVYGMNEAKTEIKRIVAQWINGSSEGYIIGFEGPPGTGKTTLAKRGIANCLKDSELKDRPFSFIALGGSTNGSTLEGHNYTYVGSTWGRIAEALMDAQCMNPIIYIDELDKISRTEHGKELIGILIHLTDPSQNEEFIDKYFSGIKLDISKCLIIFSYNDVTQVDRVLLDRIHRIKINSLSRYDKFMVATKHLIPEICQTVGININDILIDNSVIYYIIDNYTYEAGARKLKERLFDIIREINYRTILNNSTILPYYIDIKLVDEIFDKRNRIQVKKISNKPSVGLVNGLYATSAGTGGITIIEAFKYLTESRLTLELTGQQGDVMKESMRVSKTIAWNLLPDTIKKTIRNESPFGIHVHCPEAAQPKDGPSAGAAITISMLSLLSNIPVNNEIAMTGEIDLNGNILAIGGLESKMEGAKNAGVKLVLCPEDNKDDIERILKAKNCPFNDPNFNYKMIKNIYEAIDIMLIGDDCSNLFRRYSDFPLDHNDYLLTFKSLCDKSSDLICIIDTSSKFNILYCSKGFSEKLGWSLKEIYASSIFTYIDMKYKESFSKMLLSTMEGEIDGCIRFKIKKNSEQMEVVICTTRLIDNIISCTMRIIK